MRRTLAIAGLAVRASIRSRLVVCLLLLLLVIVAALPLTIQSDGTPEGQIRILVGYTMGLASFILSMTALWSGALSIAREIDEKQIQLLCSKPVHRFELWLGKWLGLTAIHTVLLSLCAGATLLGLYIQNQRTTWSPEEKERTRREVWTAWRPLQPAPFDVESAARAAWQERSSGISAADAQIELSRIRQEFMVAAHTLPPGTRQTWTFPLPAGLQPDAEWRLKFRFSTSQMGSPPMHGTWLAGPPGDESRIRITATNTPGVPRWMSLPGIAAEGQTALRISYVNDHPEPITIVFPPQDGLVLQVSAGRFPANFARAVIITALRLALLTALGVTASTLFSTPVAAFMALAAVVFLQAAGYVGTLATGAQPIFWRPDAPMGTGLLDAAIRLIFKALNLILAPLQTGHPLDDAATGIWVSPGLVLQTAIVQILIYGGALALLATVVFNRREVARPSS